MEFNAFQIAEILNGEVVGNGQTSVFQLAKIEEGKKGALSFLSNPKYEEYIYETKSSVCIVNNDFVPVKNIPDTLTLIKVDDAYACFAKLLAFYQQMKQKSPEIEKQSFVHESVELPEDIYLGAFSYISKGVKIGKNAQIYPNVFVGENVQIQDNCILYPHVSIYADCVIGNRCILHSGVIIGADGFGFAPNSKGEYEKIPQIGNVILEDDVEIGANSTIDRATLGSTIIRKGVKIDNLCQIAHNVEVGEHTVMAAFVGIAGSAKIGKKVMIGGQVGIAGHLKIADETKIVAQSGIPGSVKKAETLMGSPAIPMEDYKKSYFGFRKLPYILKKIQEFDQYLKEKNKKQENG
ncbi:MAG: UDP-3-O-(3-hydroxymyristoyl)glucosamine N-acyltransferase [Flavobacteriia bacterium]|nr:UDP-3-O-(3-hydroxymyristoyl)glucosamine N-acyltransferase [Flavobacteriia bacterium]